MKKIIAALVVVALLVAAWLWSAGRERHPIQLTDMPWQITQSAEGRIRVFGIELEKTTLQALMQSWKRLQPEIGLFISKNGEKRLEAYLGNRRLGLFDAKVIIALEADDKLLDSFSGDSASVKPMPSGDYKLELSEKHLQTALRLPISSITYIPKVKYDERLLEKYFSQPAEKLPHSQGGTFWLYPDSGLAVLLDPDGKEIFHYVNPEKFPALVEKLKQESELRLTPKGE